MRVNEPSYMSFLLTSDIPTSVGLGALLISTIIVLVLIAILFIHKRRKAPKKVDDSSYGTGERMVYAYVDTTDASRTVIGVRPPNFRLEPVDHINRNIEAAVSQYVRFFNFYQASFHYSFH